MKKSLVLFLMLVAACFSPILHAQDNSFHLEFTQQPDQHKEGFVEFGGKTVSSTNQPATFVLRCGYTQDQPDPVFEQFATMDVASGNAVLYQLIDNKLIITLKDPKSNGQKYLLQLVTNAGQIVTHSCFLSADGLNISGCQNAVPLFNANATQAITNNVRNACSARMNDVAHDMVKSNYDPISSEGLRGRFRGMVNALESQK